MKAILPILVFCIQTFNSSAQSWEELNQKVSDFATNGVLDSAEFYGNKALQKAEADFGKNHSNYFRALNILAIVIDMSGHFEKAEPYYLQALEVQKAITGEKHQDYINALNQLAVTYRNQNNLASAILYLTRANDLSKIVFGANSREYAKSLEDLGAAHDDNGAYDKAEPFFLASRDIRLKIFGEEHPAYASILNNLALLYQHKGRYTDALSLYQQSLAIKKLTSTANSIEYSVTLSNLASLYCDMGDYEKAEPLYLQALRIDENAFGADSPEAARSLNNLATYYYDLREDEKAKDLFIKALSINRRLYGNIHEEVAVILNNLGQLYQRMDFFDKAEENYLEAIEIREQTIGKEHPRFIGTAMGLAGLYYQQKKYNEAAAIFEGSLPIIKKTLGVNHPTYALGMNNLSLVYTDTKRYKESENLLLNALAIAEQNGNDPNLSNYINNLGLLYRHMGMQEKTSQLFKKGFEVSLSNLKKNFNFLTEKEKEKFSYNTLLEFNGYQSFYLDYSKLHPEAAGIAMDIELASKGMILNTGIEMRELIRSSGDLKAIQLFEKWTELKTAIAKEYALPVANRSKNLEVLESNANELEKKLARESGAFGLASETGTKDWKRLQLWLRPNQAIVEFTSFRYRDALNWTDSIIYAAFVLRKSDPYPQFIYLCHEKQLDSLMKKPGSTNERFVSNLYRGLEGKSNQSLGQGKKLYQMIWQPLDHLLKPGDWIYYSAAGILNQVAFAAVPWDSTQYISDRYQLMQLSSANVIISDAVSISIQPSLSLFGGIDYGLKGPWNYLPGTRAEVNAIAKIAAQNKIEYQLIEGKEASEKNFKERTGRHLLEIIHIASHGFFFPDPAIEKPESAMGNEIVFRNSDNPLNRSGIVLANANQAWSGKVSATQDEDGILTAYEVANRYYGKHSVWLVVLSACETGLGDIKGKEGVFGLQRAFKLAGAEMLLMSLWKVPDAETAEFMEMFYSKLFGQNMAVQGAFLQTQQYMKKKYPKEPYKWAAFVLVN